MQRSFAELHPTCFQGANLLYEIETPALAKKISSLSIYDLQNMELFIEIIFELNCTELEAPGSIESGRRSLAGGKRVNVSVMNDKVGKSPLDADGRAGGDENVTPAECFGTSDETILKGNHLGVAVVFFCHVPYNLSVSGRCLHIPATVCWRMWGR